MPSQGTSGQELFGNYTLLPDGQLAPNGYAALAAFDTPALGGNGDGVIDKQDAVFSHLCVWIDRDHNGVSEPSEILSLAEAHIVRIELSNVLSPGIDRHGNEFRYLSVTWVQDSDGREYPVLTSDVYLVMRE